MKLNVGVLRVWLYRVLVAAACTLTFISFKMSWWYAFLGSGRTIHIYGWGLRHNLLQLAPYIAEMSPPLIKAYWHGRILHWLLLRLYWVCI
jgi:hypothetical protein